MQNDKESRVFLNKLKCMNPIQKQIGIIRFPVSASKNISSVKHNQTHLVEAFLEIWSKFLVLKHILSSRIKLSDFTVFYPLTTHQSQSEKKMANSHLWLIDWFISNHDRNNSGMQTWPFISNRLQKSPFCNSTQLTQATLLEITEKQQHLWTSWVLFLCAFWKITCSSCQRKSNPLQLANWNLKPWNLLVTPFIYSWLGKKWELLGTAYLQQTFIFSPWQWNFHTISFLQVITETVDKGKPLTSFYSKQQQRAVSRTSEMFDLKPSGCASEQGFGGLHFLTMHRHLKEVLSHTWGKHELPMQWSQLLVFLKKRWFLKAW